MKPIRNVLTLPAMLVFLALLASGHVTATEDRSSTSRHLSVAASSEARTKSAAGIPAGCDLYALTEMFSPTDVDHVYFAYDDNGLNNIDRYKRIGYEGPRYVGSVYVGSSCNSRADLTPLYRLWNGGLKDHFYTTGDFERALAKSQFGYIDESIEAYVFREPAPGLSPLYRYWNQTGGDHFYTTTRNDSGYAYYGYAFEKIQAYVIVFPIPISEDLNKLKNEQLEPTRVTPRAPPLSE